MKQFGEKVEGYSIPVLNEREIRAAGGILFLFVFIAINQIIYTGNFLLLKYFILLFLVDFGIRLFVGPKYSPTLIIGRLIVIRQTPEYVGAAQKRFAWIIGFVLASTMTVLLVIFNSVSFITSIICLICFLFLFFESVFGICFGCIFYGWFYKEKAQHCPGEICDVKSRHEIQKVTWLQIFTVIIFIAFAIASFIVLKEYFLLKPINLMELINK